jgi:hypothetical protein
VLLRTWRDVLSQTAGLWFSTDVPCAALCMDEYWALLPSVTLRLRVYM